MAQCFVLGFKYSVAHKALTYTIVNNLWQYYLSSTKYKSTLSIARNSCMSLTLHALDLTCSWPCIFLTLHALDLACLRACMLLTLHVLNLACLWSIKCLNLSVKPFRLLCYSLSSVTILVELVLWVCLKLDFLVKMCNIHK